jgi:signal transduction histidine kinase
MKLLLTAVVLLLATTLNASDARNKDEAIALVKEAVKLLNEKGDSALSTIATKKGQFHKGKLYAFVYDENVVMLAHPVKPHLKGRSYKGKPDVKGKKFRDEIVSKALSGGGWTDYSYQKPGTKGIFKKSSYSEAATNGGKKYIVAAGIYLD